MYTSFYNLKTKPFQISSDPRFMWLGEKHKEALATLKYGVLDNKGFLLLTGDVGTGKTTLINSLIQSLSDDVIYASVSDPSLSKLDFFNFIAASFGIDKEFSTKGAFLVRFRKFLFDAYEEKKTVLLIIDESQLLTQELLEEIRLLSNIEKTDTKLINIFFVGQNEFNAILNQEQNRAVRQRLTLNYNIDPLTPDEISEYIKYRLKVAGATETIFEPSAVQEIFMYSGGFPRRINVICDHALLSGYVKNDKSIGSHIVKECAKELKIPLFIRNRNINGYEKPPSKPKQQEAVRPPVSKPLPLIREKKEKEKGNFLFGVVLFIIFGLLCWWLMFPAGFQQFLSRTSTQIDILKTNTAHFFSTPQKPPQIESQSDPVKYGVVPVNTPENQTKAEHQSQDRPEIPDSESTTHNSLASREERAPVISTVKTAQGQEEMIKKTEAVMPETLELTEGLNGTPDDDPLFLDSSLKQDETIKEKVGGISDTYPDVQEDSLPPINEKIIIRFKYNSNDFTEEGLNKIKNFSDVLVQHPDTRILIAGYTDSAGNQNYNQKLSEFRANIVKSFLLGRGVKPDQVEIKGLGSVHPIESNATSWGRMMNRRVEIETLK